MKRSLVECHFSEKGSDDEVPTVLFPVSPTETHEKSAMERFLCSDVVVGTVEEKWLALVAADEKAETPVWPELPPSGTSVLFAAVVPSKKSSKQHRGRMMALSMDSSVDEERARQDAVWVPCGEGQMRTSDNRLFFALTYSALPSAYCTRAFPCSDGFAPCVPVGHRARGSLTVTKLAARRSDSEQVDLEFAIVHGGCRPRFCVLVRSQGRVLMDVRHSQPGMLLERVMQSLLCERWSPHPISNELASLFFGMRVERVWSQLLYAKATRK